ncbi:MAG: DUF5805 domain-containing protein [Halanaeroarchaeum sp.]
MEETDRAVVTTYLPQRQKEIWQDHADALDMSQSEFVKTMVQAGRRWFDTDKSGTSAAPTSGPDPQGSGTENRGSNESGPNDFESVVLDALDEHAKLSWEELLNIVTEDVEAELADAINRLQERNEISHNPRQGGYVRVKE